VVTEGHRLMRVWACDQLLGLHGLLTFSTFLQQSWSVIMKTGKISPRLFLVY